MFLFDKSLIIIMINGHMNKGNMFYKAISLFRRAFVLQGIQQKLPHPNFCSPNMTKVNMPFTELYLAQTIQTHKCNSSNITNNKTMITNFPNSNIVNCLRLSLLLQ